MNRLIKQIQSLISIVLVSTWVVEDGVRPFSSFFATQPQNLSPLSGMTRAAVSPETDPELKALLDSTRGLAFTLQADALDQALRAYAQRKGKRYLRVSVRNREEMERLRCPLALKEGKLQKLDSPLYDLVFDGGILFLDYQHSDPKLAEEFNSVFDRIARFEGKEVSPDLIVIGGINRQHFARHPTSFYSRYNEVRNKEFKEKDPLEKVKEPPADFHGARIHLHATSQFQDFLVGKYFFTPDGELQFGKSFFDVGGHLVVEEGDLAKALREGKPLLLQNAPWENEAFVYFIRQLFIQGGLEVNGEWLPIQKGFALYRETVDESAGVAQKKVIPPSENGEPVWVLNSETLDLLFSIPQVNEAGQMTQKPGLLYRPGETIRLRVTEPLPNEIWHQIFHAAGPIEIEVTNPDWIPVVYRFCVEAEFKTASEKTEALSWEEALQRKSFYVRGEDLSVAQELVRQKSGKKDGEVWVYPITPETALADLSESLEVGPGKGPTDVEFILPPRERGVLEALGEGKTVILEGIDRNPSLMRQLESLLIERSYWMLNGNAVSLSLCPGQLILTGKADLSEGMPQAAKVMVSPAENDEIIKNVIQKEAFFSKLIQLRDLYRKMSLPYPFTLSLDKVRMLLQFSDWAEGFDTVFLNPYAYHPKLHAAMREEMRKILGGDSALELPPLGRCGEEQKETILWILKKFRMVFFKGLPGVGKSFICQELGETLGYAENEIYSVSSGANVQESDLVSSHCYDAQERRSFYQDQKIALWAKNPKGGLLIWDEANLPKENFTQFLAGLTARQPFIWINGERMELTPRHRVIFTGNPETIEGRQFQNLVEEKVITLNFAAFNADFLRQQIRELIPVSMENAADLVEWILTLHQFFESARPELGYSLRDIQELTSRIRLAGKDRQWRREEALYIVWNLYNGLLDREEKLALQALLENRFGIAIAEEEEKALEKTRQFVEKDQPPSYEGIGWAQGALKTVEIVDDFLRMRQARKKAKGKREYLGKWALTLEGPSGAGKDDLVERTLRARGLEEGRDYEVWVASPYKIDELKEILEKAARDGKVVVLSEMNLVATAVLEGMLNTLLTEQGVFKPGFAVISTINSVDFQGREAFSTAFKNRLNYHRVYDYTQEGLLILARAKLREAPAPIDSVVRTLIGAHCWIRDHVAGPHQRPTLREFFRALERLRNGEPIESVLRSVYSAIYFENILSGEKIPSAEKYSSYKEKDPVDWEKAYRIATEALVGRETASRFRFVEAREEGNPRPKLVVQHTIEVTGKNGDSQAWASVIAGAARHLFHLPVKEGALHRSNAAFECYTSLELYRLLQAIQKFHILRNPALLNPEKQCRDALRQLDLNYFIKTSEKDLFVSLIALAALNEIDLQDQTLNELCDAAGKSALIQKLKRALPHAKAMLESLPATSENKAVLQAQSQSFTHFQAIRPIWDQCADEVAPSNPFEEETAVPAAAPSQKELSSEEMRARIQAQKQARLEMEKKALMAELERADAELRKPLREIQMELLKIFHADKIRSWRDKAASLKLDLKEKISSFKKILKHKIEIKQLDEDIDRLASTLTGTVHDETQRAQWLKTDIAAFRTRLSQLNLTSKDQVYLRLKIWRLTRLLQSQWMEGGKPLAELLGDNFNLTTTEGKRRQRPYRKKEIYSGLYAAEGTPTVRALDYFSPYVFPHLRMEILSRIEGTILYANHNLTFQEIPMEPGTKKEWEEKGFQVFEASMEIDLVPGKKIPIASVGDEQHFFNIDLSHPEAEGRRISDDLTLWKDSDDMFYVESKTLTGKTVLRYSIAVHNRYFGVDIPEDLEVGPQAKSAEIHPDILWALKQINLKPEERRIKKILQTLARAIHSFTDDPIPLDQRTGNVFRDSIYFKRGACEQRAYVFAVVAQALGLRARVVNNWGREGEGVHSFPEVWIPHSGWLRIVGLGGQASRIVDKPTGARHQPSHEVDFARRETIRSPKRKPARVSDSERVPEETVYRHKFMAKITRQNKERLRQLLQNVFYQALKGAGEREPSQNGSHLSVQQLVQDPSRPYLSMAPQMALLPKRLILTGPFQLAQWNPFLEELIFYLLEEGTQIAVYEGEDVEPYPIKTVKELKERLAAAPEVSEKNVQRYVTRECNPETTAAIALRDLQRRVEALYLESAFDLAIDGKFEETDRPSEKPEAAAGQKASESAFSWLEEMAAKKEGLQLEDAVRVEDEEEKILAISKNGKYYASCSEKEGVFTVKESESGKEVFRNSIIIDLTEKLQKGIIRQFYVSQNGKFALITTEKQLFLIQGGEIEGIRKIDLESSQYVVEAFDVDEEAQKIIYIMTKENSVPIFSEVPFTMSTAGIVPDFSKSEVYEWLLYEGEDKKEKYFKQIYILPGTDILLIRKADGMEGAYKIDKIKKIVRLLYLASKSRKVPFGKYYYSISDSITKSENKIYCGPIDLTIQKDRKAYEFPLTMFPGKKLPADQPQEITLSPDGRYLAVIYRDDPRVYCISIQESPTVIATQELGSQPVMAKFLPGGKGLEVLTQDGTTYRWMRPKTETILPTKPMTVGECSEFGWLRSAVDPAKAIAPKPRDAEDNVETMPVSRNGRYHVRKIKSGEKLLGADWYHTQVIDTEDNKVLFSENASPTIEVSDDGEVILICYNTKLEVYFPTSKLRIPLIEFHNPIIVSSAMNQDQSAVYFVTKIVTNEGGEENINYQLYRIPLPQSPESAVQDPTQILSLGHPPMYLFPDGSGYLVENFLTNQWDIYFIPKEGIFPNQRLDIPEELRGKSVFDVAMSPDHKLLVLRSGETLYFVPTDGKPYFTAKIPDVTGQYWRGFRFTPDGKEFQLYLIDPSGKPYILRWMRPKTETVLPAQPMTVGEWMECKSNMRIGTAKCHLLDQWKKEGEPIIIKINDQYHLAIDLGVGICVVETRTDTTLWTYSVPGINVGSVAIGKNYFAFYDPSLNQLKGFQILGDQVQWGMNIPFERSYSDKIPTYLIYEDLTSMFVQDDGDKKLQWGCSKKLQWGCSEKSGTVHLSEKLFSGKKAHFIAYEKEKETEDARLVVVTENALYHVAVAKIRDGSVQTIGQTDPWSFPIVPAAKIKTGKIKQVAFNTKSAVAAVLTEDGKLTLHKIESNPFSLMRPQELEMPAGEDLAASATLLYFSPDGKALHCETRDKRYTWTFGEEDMLQNLWEKYKSQGSPQDMLLTMLVASLASPKETLAKVRRSMEARGRLREFEEQMDRALGVIDLSEPLVVDRIVREMHKSSPPSKKIGQGINSNQKVEVSL